MAQPPNHNPPHPPITQERKISKHGMELSERGLPVTPWHSKSRVSHSTSPPFGAPEGSDAEGYEDLYDGEDYDDPDDFDTGRPFPSWQRPPRFSRPSAPHQHPRPLPRPTLGEQNAENNIRKRVTSTSLYYTWDPTDPMANQVAWLAKSIDGPYAGKHERLAKCPIKLLDDSAGSFFVFYNSLRSYLASNGFHAELFPALQHISDALDLTLSPISTDMPKVGAYDGGEKKPMFDWTEAHNEFSQTLYALFASHGVIATSAVRSANILVSYQFSGSGLQVRTYSDSIIHATYTRKRHHF